MRTKGFIIAAAILLIARNAVGQDSLSHNAALPKDNSASAASQNLATSEKTAPEARTVSKSKRGRHNIQLSIGLLSDYGVESEVSSGVVANVVGGDGFMGAIAYSYWAQEGLAFNFGVGVIASEVNTSASGSRVSVETSSVVPILFGIKYEPLTMSLSESVRPYLFASVGPCVGSATHSRTSTNLQNETYTETTLASHFGLGTDFLLSRLFVAGVSAGYYLTTDFGRPIGGQKNYSSPEFTLSIGILLGSGKK